MWKSMALHVRPANCYKAGYATPQEMAAHLRQHKAVGWEITIRTKNLIVLAPSEALQANIKAGGWYAVIYWKS